MARFGRNKNKAKTVQVIDEKKYDYRQIWSDLHSMDDKAGWKLSDIPADFQADYENEDKPVLMYFYDLALEKQTQEIAGNDAEVENIQNLMNEVAEKSQLTNLEVEEAEFYVRRVSLYDAINKELIDLIVGVEADPEAGIDGVKGLLEGAHRDDAGLPIAINDKISEVGKQISVDTKTFKEEYKNITIIFDRTTGEVKETRAKTDQAYKEAQNEIGMISKMIEQGSDLAAGLADAAKKGGGWLSGKLFGRKNVSSEQSRFEAHFKELAAKGQVLRQLQKRFGEMSHELTYLYEQGYKPVLENAFKLGRKFDENILRYDQYIGALEELERRFEDSEEDGGFIAVAQKNSENGDVYKAVVTHVMSAHEQVKTRLAWLTKMKAEAELNMKIASNYVDEVEKDIQETKYQIEQLPSMDLRLDGIIMQMDQMKNKKVLADSLDYDEILGQLSVDILELGENVNQEVANAKKDQHEHVRRQLEKADEIADRKEQRRLEEIQNNEEGRRMLEEASATSAARAEERAKKRALEGDSYVKKGGSALDTSKKGAKKTPSNDDGSLNSKFAKSANDDKPEAKEEITSEDKAQERKEALEKAPESKFAAKKPANKKPGK